MEYNECVSIALSHIRLCKNCIDRGKTVSIDDIRQLCAADAIYWSAHLAKRLIKWGIARNDVKCAINNGKIIEDYPEDYPHPSCLISGHGENGDALHVVCGSEGTQLWMITTYKPDLTKWDNDTRV